MNQNTDFSKFLGKIAEIIQNGQAAQNADKHTLEGMHLQALLKERHADAKNINLFLDATKQELALFKAAANLGSSPNQAAPEYQVKTWKFWKKNSPLNPSNFMSLTHYLTPETPFALVEGLLVEKIKGTLVEDKDKKSPFFAAVALNTSKATTLGKGNLVCLFNLVGKDVELRLWEMGNFAKNLSGRSFDETVLNIPPDANETIVKRHTLDESAVDMSGLFQKAAERMTMASLSNNPNDKAVEGWLGLIRNYTPTPIPSALVHIPALK